MDFRVKTKEDKQLLSIILKETDSTLLKWAIHQIVNWKNDFSPENLNHIHGTVDRILPASLVNNKIEIKGGGHLMVLDKADEISENIKNLI